MKSIAMVAELNGKDVIEIKAAIEHRKAFRLLLAGQLEWARARGAAPTFDPMRIKSANWLYDVRPGDFRQEGLTWVASRTLGPGDLEAVPGFVWDRE